MVYTHTQNTYIKYLPAKEINKKLSEYFDYDFSCSCNLSLHLSSIEIRQIVIYSSSFLFFWFHPVSIIKGFFSFFYWKCKIKNKQTKIYFGNAFIYTNTLKTTMKACATNKKNSISITCKKQNQNITTTTKWNLYLFLIKFRIRLAAVICTLWRDAIRLLLPNPFKPISISQFVVGCSLTVRPF